MFKPLSLYIGLRYTSAKRRNHFISFIALTSMIGIALGVMVLITVLSVMNGFDREIKQQIFGIAQHITITHEEGRLENWPQWSKKLNHFPGVLGIAPFVNSQTLLSYRGRVIPAMLTGILPEEEKHVSTLAEKMTSGRLTNLKPGEYGIIIGEELADNLGINIGDKLKVITSQINMTPVGLLPQARRFTVVGLFRIGGGFRFDNSLAFVAMSDAQKLMSLPENSVTGIRLKIKDLFSAPHLSFQIAESLPEAFFVDNWTRQFGPFFQSIKLEKNMMFLILLLIIAVAAFNLVSSLVMVVTDKRSDIAILRTLGVTPFSILKIFMIQGCLIGFMGTLLGVIGGIILSPNVTVVVNFIQHILHTKLISSDVYFIDYLPSELIWTDVIKVGLCAFAMSVIATIYPALRAANIQPAEALRYE